MRAVRYNKFQGIDGLYIGELPDPEPAGGEVVVRVEASALNPGTLPALYGADYVPGRDFAGTVEAKGADVAQFAVGDAVMGRVQSWDGHAELIAVDADTIIGKPDDLSWDVAGALYTNPMAALSAIQAVEPRTGELLVVAGASGGVGLTAAQLGVLRGATVIGLTSPRHFDVLRRLGITPVEYGDGQEARLREATSGAKVDAFIDTVGRGYVDLALRLGVAKDRINTIVDFAAAKTHGVKALGTTAAGGTAALTELARLTASGELQIPIAATFPLDAVQDAYRALESRETYGRIVLHPQESA